MSKPELRNRHEAKPDQDAGFKDGHQPSTRVNPKLRVGNSQREPWPRQEGNREKIRLTGQWLDRHETFHLFINQAGTHIELLIAFVEARKGYSKRHVPRDEIRTKSRVFRMGADLDLDFPDRRTYKLYGHDGAHGPTGGKDLVCGSLHRSQDGKAIQLELDVSQLGADPEMVAKLAKIARAAVDRIGTAPNLFENHLNIPSVPPEVRTMLWFPPTPRQARALPKFIFDARVRLNPDNYLAEGKTRRFGYVELVERYFEIQSSKSYLTGLGAQALQWLKNIAMALDVLVGKASSNARDAELEQGGIDAHQAEYWRVATLEALSKKKLMLDPGQPRTLLTLTQAIIDGAPDQPTLEWFKNELGLESRSGTHEYEAEITLADLDGSASDLGKVFEKLGNKAAKKLLEKIKKQLPFGAAAGSLVVRKLADGPFEASYVIALAGVKISKSAGSSAAAVYSTGVSQSPLGQAWRPENIPGVARWTDVSASAFGGGSGIAGGMSLLTCMGSGATAPRSPLGINFSGTANIVAPGVGAGVGGMVCFGRIVGIESSGGDVKLLDLPDRKPLEYKVPSTALHFPINGAGLTQEGTDLVEIFAACELFALTRRSVKLELHGYADQPDTELNNLILSRNRAITVYNFLKNILGSDLPTGDLASIEEESVEKKNAKKMIGDDGKEYYDLADPSIKRVTIRAHGEPKDGANHLKPGYDASLRRVDLNVSGIVSLQLRRKNDK